MPIKIICWNIEHLNLVKIQDHLPKIIQVLRKYDICILLENKNKPIEILENLQNQLKYNFLCLRCRRLLW